VTDEVRVGEWNAHFSLGEDDRGKFVIFHSRGGDTTPSGEKRNHQYADGLETILCRLAGLNGSVKDALVDSVPARKLEEEERRLRLESRRFTYPIRLGGIGRVKDDFKALRLSMGKAQIPVGQANPGPNPKGNSTKKIRIYIDTADDVGLDELERVLGRREGPSDLPQESESAGEDAGHADSSHPDAPDDDITQRQISARKVRGGQPMFRRNLLRAYGEKCSISGTGPRGVLEAVHIVPHAESGINALDNGLLLRADLHNLFDDGLLRINPDSLMVELSPEFHGTDYRELNGVRLRDRSDGSRQSREFLKQRWAEGTS
jgi:hypothetical protein